MFRLFQAVLGRLFKKCKKPRVDPGLLSSKKNCAWPDLTTGGVCASAATLFCFRFFFLSVVFYFSWLSQFCVWTLTEFLARLHLFSEMREAQATGFAHCETAKHSGSQRHA